MKSLEILKEAVKLLLRVEQKKDHLAPLLQRKTLPKGTMEKLTDLVYGVIRWQGFLDHVISQFSRRPLRKLDVEVKIILRIGVFLMFHAKYLPRPAIVNDAVELSNRFKPYAKDYVNALLRRIAKIPTFLSLLPTTSDPVAYLSVRYSHPAWLVERWLKTFGRTITEAILKLNQTPPKTDLVVFLPHIHRDALMEKLSQWNILADPVADIPTALTVKCGNPLPFIKKHPTLARIQDVAAQGVAWLAASLPAEVFWEVASAPGGKSFAYQALRKAQNLHLASDVSLGRLTLARRSLKGLPMLWFVADGQAPPFLPHTLEGILLDAPCSGTGTLQKNPEVKWRLSPEGIQRMAQKQERLLKACLPLLKPGGWLIYTTCSLESQENEEVIHNILQKSPGYRILKNSDVIPEILLKYQDNKGFFRWYPTDLYDGHFASILKRDT